MPLHRETIHPSTPSEAGLCQLVYCSLLKEPLTQDEVASLLAQARSNNALNAITGQLMMDDGLVIQWLEGPSDRVRSLWRKLLADTRHHCVVPLVPRKPLPTRAFSDWAMRAATRQEMVEIVKFARDMANDPNEPASPWAPAVATLCVLLEQDSATEFHMPEDLSATTNGESKAAG